MNCRQFTLVGFLKYMTKLLLTTKTWRALLCSSHCIRQNANRGQFCQHAPNNQKIHSRHENDKNINGKLRYLILLFLQTVALLFLQTVALKQTTFSMPRLLLLVVTVTREFNHIKFPFRQNHHSFKVVNKCGDIDL